MLTKLIGYLNTKYYNINNKYYLGEVCEMMSLCHYFHTEVGTVIRTEGVAENLLGKYRF